MRDGHHRQTDEFGLAHVHDVVAEQKSEEGSNGQEAEGALSTSEGNNRYRHDHKKYDQGLHHFGRRKKDAGDWLTEGPGEQRTSIADGCGEQRDASHYAEPAPPFWKVFVDEA